MTDSTSGASQSGIGPVWFTLLGIIITAGLSCVSANQTASVGYRQSCLARIDAREATIRSKVDTFFAAQGNIISFASHRQKDDVELEKRLDAVSAAAYSLSSYLDDDMDKTPKLIALSLMEMFSPNKSEEELKNAPKTNEHLGDEMDKWNQQFTELMGKFESDRKRC